MLRRQATFSARRRPSWASRDRGGWSAVAAALARAVGGSRPAAIVSNATLPSERKVWGPLDYIARLADKAGIEAPAVLVVGDVVAAARMVAALQQPLELDRVAER